VQITDCSWESRRVWDVHEWVSDMGGHCRSVWEYMGTSPQFEASLLREQVWMEVTQAAYDCVLEGFTRVRKCSMEGRSAMLMDCLALHDELNRTHLCRPPRGKDHVEAILRAALLSEAELMAWVLENWQAYSYRHIHGVLAQNLASLLNRYA
jgi:hypothetical protein